jgi:hypothetical protein
MAVSTKKKLQPLNLMQLITTSGRKYVHALATVSAYVVRRGGETRITMSPRTKSISMVLLEVCKITEKEAGE